jgi:ketosteroid isomerase-like protein
MSIDLGQQMDTVNGYAMRQEWDEWFACFAADATLWQNFGGKSTAAAAVARFRKSGIQVDYSNVRRITTGNTLVEQHDTTITMGSKSVTTPMCLIVEFDDAGLITSVAEYADSAAFAALT